MFETELFKKEKYGHCKASPLCLTLNLINQRGNCKTELPYLRLKLEKSFTHKRCFLAGRITTPCTKESVALWQSISRMLTTESSSKLLMDLLTQY